MNDRMAIRKHLSVAAFVAACALTMLAQHAEAQSNRGLTEKTLDQALDDTIGKRFRPRPTTQRPAPNPQRAPRKQSSRYAFPQTDSSRREYSFPHQSQTGNRSVEDPPTRPRRRLQQNDVDADLDQVLDKLVGSPFAHSKSIKNPFAQSGSRSGSATPSNLPLALTDPPPFSVQSSRPSAPLFTTPAFAVGHRHRASAAEQPDVNAAAQPAYKLAEQPRVGEHFFHEKPQTGDNVYVVPYSRDDFSADPIDPTTPYEAEAQMSVYQDKTLNANQRPLLEIGRPWYQLGELKPGYTFLG